jgi:riboflavin kinase / FMN adenylyltransferase
LKVYNSLKEFQKLEKAVVTTGTFDGVHLGHQLILTKLVERARKVNGESVLITFFPHPRMILQKDMDIKLLNTIDEKIELLEKTGLDHLIILKFTKEFSRIKSIDFVRDILVNKIGTKKLVIGYDHQFGRNREGSFEHLKEFGPIYGFDVEEISAKDIESVAISSTKIRKFLLEDGDVKNAAIFLGKNYSLCGKVVNGKKIGSKIGFPTANIEPKENYKLIPRDGVYAIFARIDGETKLGMANIGIRPTIDSESDNKKTIEVNIFDFDKDIYGNFVSICFVERIRDEKKFENIESLKEQLERDMNNSKRILQQSKNC